MNDSRIHLFVFGRVQGVGFRYFAKRKADSLLIRGWTRNCSDRSVEIIAEGNRQNLDLFLKAISSGPPSSNVSKVTENWESATGEFTEFSIKRTHYFR